MPFLFLPRVRVLWTNKPQIGARNLIVKHLARVIVESTMVKMVRKAAKYPIQVRSVQVESFVFPAESSGGIHEVTKAYYIYY